VPFGRLVLKDLGGVMRGLGFFISAFFEFPLGISPEGPKGCDMGDWLFISVISFPLVLPGLKAGAVSFGH
jgi:hypothetical protein